jgi:release factor glutamine methyltransferase
LISLLLQGMNLKQLLQQFTIELQDVYGVEEAKAMFYMVAEHLSALRKSDLILKGQEDLKSGLELKYLSLLEELKAGKPIQYALGEAEFYGLSFRVNPAVLIPRPETEELVEWVLNTSRTANKSMDILDIGTGSGCIAIALQKELPKAKVSAMDISVAAIETAKENAKRNQVAVEFIQADILNYTGLKKYDLIISNPPYVKLDEKPEMLAHVLDHEPHLALFVGNENPLVFYKAIAAFAKLNLVKNGYLFFEINEYLGKEMVDMLVSNSFIDIELKKDMQGADRMIRCRYKPS